ncbi:MAG: cupin domain-containing protein [Planctomycetes bacterium]|nr:cupin domain-containing protein [Planctomycetota bacterium]MBI3835146.1 cupin domain-containing protein [Planctomycetota bacterium]
MDRTFFAWTEYWGRLFEDDDSRVSGFENISSGTMSSAEVENDGACFGFVSVGQALLLGNGGRESVTITTGQWFSTPGGCKLLISDSNTAVFIAQRKGYRGVFTVGGPIEKKGRLRYIDGCSDSLLCCPPVIGDPCLNHLHFPGGIDQTQHTHPSLRAGIVAKGEGWCITHQGKTQLETNLIFVIPTDASHSFKTEAGQCMDVVPYHPDSDWGPSHEEHPMVNRTLVEGKKIDNTLGRHTGAELIAGMFLPIA